MSVYWKELSHLIIIINWSNLLLVILLLLMRPKYATKNLVLWIINFLVNSLVHKFYEEYLSWTRNKLGYVIFVNSIINKKTSNKAFSNTSLHLRYSIYFIWILWVQCKWKVLLEKGWFYQRKIWYVWCV